jgi:preprotein translocase subunit YajC
MINLNYFNVILADAASAPGAPAPAAPAGSPPAPQTQGSPLGFFVPLALMLVILYFMMIRPQSQQRKRQAQLLANLKPGDKVVTASGIVGVVTSVKDKTVSLRSADAKMEMTKSSVTEIIERSGETSAS